MPAFETEFSPTSSAVRRSSSWGEAPLSPKHFQDNPFKAASTLFQTASSDEVTSPRSSSSAWRTKDAPPRSPSHRSAAWETTQHGVPNRVGSFSGDPTSPPLSPTRSVASRWKPVADRWPSPEKSSTSTKAAPRWRPPVETTTVTSRSEPGVPSNNQAQVTEAFSVVDRWPSPQKKIENSARSLPGVAKRFQPQPSVNTVSSNDASKDQPQESFSVVDRWPSPQKKTTESSGRSLPSVAKRWQKPPSSTASVSTTTDGVKSAPAIDTPPEVAKPTIAEPPEAEPPNPWKNALKGAKAKWKPKAPTPPSPSKEPEVTISRSQSTVTSADDGTAAPVIATQRSMDPVVDTSPVVKPSRGNVANRWLQQTQKSSTITDAYPSPQKSTQSTPSWKKRNEEQPTEPVPSDVKPSPLSAEQDSNSDKREEDNSGTSLDLASETSATPRPQFEKPAEVDTSSALVDEEQVKHTPKEEATSPTIEATTSPRQSTPSQALLRTASRDSASWIKSPASSIDPSTPNNPRQASGFEASPVTADEDPPSAAASPDSGDKARSTDPIDDTVRSTPESANSSPEKCSPSKATPSPSVPHIAPASKSVSSLLKEFGAKTPVGMASQNKGRWLSRSSSNTDSPSGSEAPAKAGEVEEKSIIPSPIGPKVSEIVKEHAARTPIGNVRRKSLGRWTPGGNNDDTVQTRDWPTSPTKSPEVATVSPAQVTAEDCSEESSTPSSQRRESVADRFKKRIASSKDNSPQNASEPAEATEKKPVESEPVQSTECDDKLLPEPTEDSNKATQAASPLVLPSKTAGKDSAGVARGLPVKEEPSRKSNFTIPSFVPPTKTYSARKLPAKKPAGYIDYEADLRRVQTVTAQSSAKPAAEKPRSQSGFHPKISQPKFAENTVPSVLPSLSRLGTRNAKASSESAKPLGFVNAWGPRKTGSAASAQQHRSDSSSRNAKEPSKQRSASNKPNTPFEIIEAWARKPGLRNDDADTPLLQKEENATPDDNAVDGYGEETLVENDNVAASVTNNTARQSAAKSPVGEEKNRKTFMNLGRRHAAKRVAQATSVASEETIAETSTFDDGTEEEAPFDEPPSPRSHASSPSDSRPKTHPRFKPVSTSNENASNLYSPAMTEDNFADEYVDMDTSMTSNSARSVTREVEPHIPDNTSSARRLAAEKIAMRKKLQSHRRRVKRDTDTDSSNSKSRGNDYIPPREPPALRSLSIDNDMAEILQPDSDTPVHSASPNFVEICETASSTVSTPSPLASKAEKLLQERRRRSFSCDTLDRMAQVNDPVRSSEFSETSQSEPEYVDPMPYADLDQQEMEEQPQDNTKVGRSSVYHSSGRFVDPPGAMNPQAPSRLARKLGGSTTNSSVASDNMSKTLSVDTSMSSSPVRHRQTKRSDRSVASESKSVNTAGNATWDPSKDIASLMSFDLKKIATAVDEQVSVIRDFVGGPQKSPSVGMMKSFECGMNNDVEDVAIEVEYIEGSSVDLDEAASDLGVFADPSLEDEPTQLAPRKKAPLTPTQQTRRTKNSDMTPGEPSFEQVPRQQGRRGYV